MSQHQDSMAAQRLYLDGQLNVMPSQMLLNLNESTSHVRDSQLLLSEKANNRVLNRQSLGSNNDEDPVNRLHLPPDTDHLLSSILTTSNRQSQVSRGGKKAKQLSHSTEVYEQEFVRVFDRKEYTQKRVEQFFLSM